MNLADLLSDQSERRPEASALLLPGKQISYAELDALVWQVAAFLHRQEVKPGDIVALDFTEELAVVIGMLAIARIGATVFSMPGSWPSGLRCRMAERAGAAIYLVDRKAPDINNLRQIALPTKQIDTLSEPIDRSIRIANPTAPWLIVAGSGSTGEPKFLPFLHAHQLGRCSTGAEWLNMTAADLVSSMMHFDFTNTKTRFLDGLAHGVPFFIPDRQQADLTRQFGKAGVTILHATVFHLERMLENPPASGKRLLDFLRVLTVGSSTVPASLRKRAVSHLCPDLRIHYGTNETGLLTYLRVPPAPDVTDSVGHPLACVEIEAVDTQGRPIPPHAIGQLRARRPGMIDGYMNEAEATRQAFRDGWLYTGDLGKRLPDGQLVYYGRADHMMIMNGINIYPAEIERVMMRHPAVRDAAAVPLPSKVHQDIPVCVVALNADATIAEKSLLDFARQHLGPRGPRRIAVLDRIPRNEQGKLIRTELLRKIQEPPRPAATSRLPAHPAIALAASKIRPRQSLRRTLLPFHCTATVDLAAIDDWLSGLEIALEPINHPVPSPWRQESEQARAAELAWRILLLNCALQQAANIPTFDPGCVLDMTRNGGNPGAWVATVAIADIEQLPQRRQAIALEEAARIVAWMMDRPRTPKRAAILFDTVLNRVLPALKRGIITGKSTLPMLRVAHGLDIPFLHLGAGIYQLGWGSQSIRVDRSTTEKDSAIGSKLAQNKVWTASLLNRAGLPAPQHGVAATEGEATRLAHRMGWPVVVKPLDRERGEGVTVGVTDGARLMEAFKIAARLSKARRAIVEREVRGVCHRLFIAAGELLYAVKRWPKSIHGDGEHTVAALIEAANLHENTRPPWLRTERYPADDLAITAMAAAGYALDSVPPAGARVPLRIIETTAWGGYDEDVTQRIHPDNLDIALRAATLFGLQIAGIDIISPDISRPWHENGAIINEVNYAPLLGGGEISRSHIPACLARLVKGDGRIPVEAVVGDDASLTAARARQEELVRAGVRCYLTSHELTLQATGEEIRFPFTSLHQRCQALLLDRRVDAIVLAIQTDELLRTGLPVDHIQRIVQAPADVAPAASRPGQDKLLALLRTAIHAE
jgi:acyl-coenzyme A synthetase/AMP-(fatty) acid ligase/D-alanine-D-alanine ligase-like ATP-grasp enzyme